MRLIRSCRWLPRLALAVFMFIGWIVGGAAVAGACTIPVFRFALERWEADRLLVVVYFSGQLAAEQDAALNELEQRSVVAGGPLNIEVVRCDLNSPSPPAIAGVQPPSAERALPWVEVRARLDWKHTALRWEGTLAEATARPGLFDSAVSGEVARRILEGESCVWLLIAPGHELPRLSKSLQTSLDAAAKELALPEGIGLPGSELYAPLPLAIRFSVLAISHEDPAEQQFLKMLATFAAEWRPDAAYIVPVIGRCRALDVIPYSDDDSPLIEDIAAFVCGACSCQVKQANPGFDLLASVNWEQRLFGELIPEAKVADRQPDSNRGPTGPADSPQYVAIPAGNEPAASAGGLAATLPPASKTFTIYYLALAAALVLVGGVTAGVCLRRR